MLSVPTDAFVQGITNLVAECASNAGEKKYDFFQFICYFPTKLISRSHTGEEIGYDLTSHDDGRSRSEKLRVKSG